MWKKGFLLLFFACFLSFFAAAGQQPEVYKPISLTELQTLTRLYQDSRANNQKALETLKLSTEQVNRLQTQVTTLQNQSKKQLNSLQAERLQTQSLQKLFSEYKRGSLSTIAKKDGIINDQKLEIQRIRHNNERLTVALVAVVFLIGLYIYLHFKKLIPF